MGRRRRAITRQRALGLALAQIAGITGPVTGAVGVWGAGITECGPYASAAALRLQPSSIDDRAAAAVHADQDQAEAVVNPTVASRTRPWACARV